MNLESKKFRKITQATKNVKDIYSFYHKYFSYYSGFDSDFPSQKFLNRYDYCFLFVVKTIAGPFLTEINFNNSFLSVKEKFTYYTPSNILNFYEKLKKNYNFFFQEKEQAQSLLVCIWTNTSQYTIIKDFLTTEQYFSQVIENDNLCLTKKIENERNKMSNLFQELNHIKENTFLEADEKKYQELSVEFSKTVLVFIEILFFRKILVENFSTIQQFSFFKFSYIQLILLLDGEIYLFLLKIISFTNQFSMLYLKSKKTEGFEL